MGKVRAQAISRSHIESAAHEVDPCGQGVLCDASVYVCVNCNVGMPVVFVLSLIHI